MNNIHFPIYHSISYLQAIALILLVIFIGIHASIKKQYVLLLLSLPSTVMHELCHLMMALLSYGRPSSFSIIPKKENDRYVLGSVEFIPTWYNAFIISMAPLILWWIALYLFFTNHVLIVSPLFYWLLVGGLPSKQDVKVGFMHGFGFILLLSTIIYWIN